MSESKKSGFRSNLLFIKDNYHWLPSIPIIIGGLYQFYCIGSIGFQYLRFFSLSQLIVDGILLICFFSLIILVLLFYLYVIQQLSLDQRVFYSYESYNEEIKRKKKERKHFTIILFLLIPLTIYLGYISWPDIKKFEFSYTVISFSFFLIILFLTILKRVFKISEIPYIHGVGYFGDTSSFRKFLHTFIHLFFYFQVFFLVYIMEPIKSNWGSFSFNDLNNTNNYNEFVKCTKREFREFKSGRILYYNDKYLFTEIITQQDTLIKIDSFESFIDGTCKMK